MANAPYNPSRMEELVARLGDLLTRASSAEALPLLKITYDGNVLPAGFVWFCLNFTNHRGWPHLPAWPGLFSPLAIASDLQHDNDKRRASGVWPKNLVSFFGTDDGVYCFQYGSGLHPTIAYVDDWTNPIGEQTQIYSASVAATFEDWFDEIIQFSQK